MPDAITLATVTVAGEAVAITLADAMIVAGAVAGAAGAVSQGRSQAKIAKHNARLMERQAVEAEQQGKIQADIRRRQARRLRSSQLAAAGAQGVDPTQGSALLVIAEAQQNATIDALNIERAGSLQAVNARSQAAADRLTASAARTSGYVGAASSLLLGAGKVGRRAGLRAAEEEALGA